MSFLKRRDEISSGFGEEKRKGFALTPEIQVAIAFGVTLVVGLICALVAFPRPSAGADEPGDVTTPDATAPTAREALVAAVEMIRETDAGAQVASGAAVWTPRIDTAQMGAGRNGWTFHFYLPASGEMATVLVDGAGRAKLEDSVPWDTPPSLLDPQRWRTDSPEVMQQFVEMCQATLDAAPDAVVEVRVSMAAENRNVLWLAKVDPGLGGTPCEVGVDATTGLLR
jgi:hypothetical protein